MSNNSAFHKRHGVVRPFVCVTAFFAAGVVALPASGQSLRGRLVDVESEDPIVSGMLTLLTPDSTLVATAVTNQAGEWYFDVPGAGRYFVHARRLGYKQWVAGPLDLDEGDDFSSVFHLQRLPVMLDPIEVSAAATRRYLSLTGFYERQKANFGHFVTLEDIEKRQATRVTDLLMALPGVRMVSLTNGSVGARFLQLRGSGMSLGGVCRPRVFVDGLMYARGDSRPVRVQDQNTEAQIEEIETIDQGLSLDDIGHPSTLAAVEVYRSASQVPVEFGGTSVETQCGVIVIWTRTGRMNRTR